MIHRIDPRVFTWALCCLLLVAIGCEKSTSRSGDGVTATTPHLDGAQKLSVSLIEAVSRPELPRPAWAPDDDALEASVREVFKTSPHIELKDPGAEPAAVFVQVGAQEITPPNSSPKLGVVALVALGRGKQAQSYRREELVDVASGLDDTARVATLNALVEDAARGLIVDLEVAKAPDDRLLEFAARAAKMPPEAAARLAGRVRVRIQAEPGDREAGAALLRALLASDAPQVVIAAAGALVMLDDPLATPALVDAAERMSQRQQWQAYVALIAQMGELSNPVTIEYLEVVASGHGDEQIRMIAAESLERARKKPTENQQKTNLVTP